MVKFLFVIKRYIPCRLRDMPHYYGEYLEPIKIQGVKTVKLFNSWLRLMENRKLIIRGVYQIGDTVFRYGC